VLALPTTGVAGLQVLVRSAAAGTTPVLVDDVASLGGVLGQLTGDRAYVSLVPTQLHRLAEAHQLELLRRFDAVLVGGAAMAAGLQERCRRAGVRLVRTYGMSETCGGCVYDGKPLDGVGVRVGAQGRISLAGPVLFDGYAGDAAATVQVLRDGWFLTSDVGRIDDDGGLVVVGRADDVVVSGGVNVALPAVTHALAGLPGVRDAAAVGVPDHEWGTRVVACLVGDSAPALSDVRDHVAATLPRTWAPRAVVLVDALPMLPSGKLDRLALHRIAADAGP
jgi:O-succinylbenzoic acid--CoA ligase